MISRFFRHIRTKLMLLHMVSVACVVILYTVSASFLLLYHLRTQLIRHAIQELETVEGLVYITVDKDVAVHEDYHNTPTSKDVLQRMLEIRSSAGDIVYRNALLGRNTLGGAPDDREGVGGYSPRQHVLEDGTAVQVVSRKHTVGATPLLIRLAYSEAPLWQHMRDEMAVLLMPLPFVLAFAGITGYLLAKRLLLPVHQMAITTERITGARLHERLPLDDADGEFAELAGVFNGMLTRLEQSFDQLRRFTSDASHELRTPLASIRSVGEVGLQRATTPAEYRDVIGSMLEEANRLTHLVDSLLTISRADAQQIVLHPSVFSLRKLMEECVSLLDVLSEERGQQLRVSCDASLQIEADWLLLRQALVNVIHNAIKYSPASTTVRVEADSSGEEYIAIAVADEGPGIPESSLGRVFDRFYRVDEARGRDTGGVGLGLAITKWVVEAHGGEVQILSKPGQETTVSLRLPVRCARGVVGDVSQRTKSVAATVKPQS